MSNFLDSLETGIKAAYCQGILSNPRFAANAGGLTDLPGLRDYFDSVNRLICDRPPQEIPFLNPPFTGGQCSGVQYTVRVQGVAQTVPFTGQNQFVLGPVLGFRFDPIGDNFRPVLRSGGPDDAAWPLIRQSEIGQWRITEVFRTFGGVDNCGDPPPPDLPAPGPITIDVDVTYGPNNEFNLTVPVIFGVAYISLDGSISIPVDVGGINLTGNLNFDGALDFSLDIPINIGGGDSPGPNLPGDPSVDPGPGDEPPPSDRVIVGVFVRAPSVSSNLPTLLPQDGAPTVLAPRVGTVKFLIRGGERSGWTPDVPVKSARAYIPCPAPQGAVAVAVTGDYGTDLEWTPLYNRPPRD